MDWDLLRTFLAVARQSTFLGAATAMKVNQATIARKISALETAFGATLFERSNSGVLLTEMGQDLLMHAEQIESEVLQAQAKTARHDPKISGLVRIGAPDGFMMYFLIPAMRALCEQHPELELQFVPMPTATSLLRRDVDLAITLERPEGARLIARKLTTHRLRIFASRHYLAQHGTPQTVDDLSAHRLIGYAEAYAFSDALNYVRDLFNGRPQHIECASSVGQTEAVRAGLGIAVLHEFIAHSLPDLVPVLPDRFAEREYWIVVHEDQRMLGRIRTVLDYLIQATASRKRIFMGQS